jgi:hypothetical protein
MRSTEHGEEAQQTDDADFAHLREHNRKPVLWAGHVETATGAIDCIALDLSLGGAKLRLTAPLPPDEAVTLVIERVGTFRARVMWQASDGGVRSAGIRFSDPAEVITRMLRRALPV